MKKQKPQFKYTIKEKKDKDEDSIIHKEGWWTGEVDFTIKDIKKDIEALRKRKIELEAERDIEEATIQNILNRYKELIEKLTDKDKIAVFLHERAKMNIQVKDEGLREINKRLDTILKELETIEKETGIKYV